MNCIERRIEPKVLSAVIMTNQGTDKGMVYTCCFIPKDFKNEWNLVLSI